MYTWAKEQHNGFQHFEARDNYLPELYIVDYDCQCFIHCIVGGIGFINRCYLGIRRYQNLTIWIPLGLTLKSPPSHGTDLALTFRKNSVTCFSFAEIFTEDGGSVRLNCSLCSCYKISCRCRSKIYHQPLVYDPASLPLSVDQQQCSDKNGER